MSGGKANIQSTDAPPNFEPHTAAITKVEEPNEEAEEEPREEHDECGLQEHSLWLSELLNGVKGEEGLWEAEGIVVNARISGHRGVGIK